MVNNRNNNNNNQQQQAAAGAAGGAGAGDHVQNRRNAANPPDGGAAVDWVQEDLERFSFDDSDRFEEDSLCSWSSEPESLYNNWRGWKKPSNFGLGNNVASSAGASSGDNPTDARGNNGSATFKDSYTHCSKTKYIAMALFNINLLYDCIVNYALNLKSMSIYEFIFWIQK